MNYKGRVKESVNNFDVRIYSNFRKKLGNREKIMEFHSMFDTS